MATLLKSRTSWADSDDEDEVEGVLVAPQVTVDYSTLPPRPGLPPSVAPRLAKAAVTAFSDAPPYRVALERLSPEATAEGVEALLRERSIDFSSCHVLQAGTRHATGFAELASRQDLEAALALKGTELGGRGLETAVARGMRGKPPPKGRGGAKAATVASAVPVSFRARGVRPVERPRLQLLPRTKPVKPMVAGEKEQAPLAPSIFGSGRPRDEATAGMAAHGRSLEAGATFSKASQEHAGKASHESGAAPRAPSREDIAHRARPRHDSEALSTSQSSVVTDLSAESESLSSVAGSGSGSANGDAPAPSAAAAMASVTAITTATSTASAIDTLVTTAHEARAASLGAAATAPATTPPSPTGAIDPSRFEGRRGRHSVEKRNRRHRDRRQRDAKGAPGGKASRRAKPAGAKSASAVTPSTGAPMEPQTKPQTHPRHSRMKEAPVVKRILKRETNQPTVVRHNPFAALQVDADSE